MAFGGLIASAKAMAVFAENYIVYGPDIGVTRANYHTYTNYTWEHSGSLDGTDTAVFEDTSGWTYSILFNQRPSSGTYVDSVVPTMQSILGAMTPAQWPAALKYPGDIDNNQWLTETDISLFNAAWQAGSQAAFLGLYPKDRYDVADFDGNQLVNAADIPGFEQALIHAGVPSSAFVFVPEPASCSILLASVLLCINRRYR
jgi:hypothetical protein